MLGLIKNYRPSETQFSITEFGGGNSCFYTSFEETFQPDKYYIVDNNQPGLDAFRSRLGPRENTVLLNRDILAPDHSWESDIVFSVGLIEHFSVEDTRKAVQAHLQVLKKGGILILAFPTPTWLYRVARKIS
ncbi:MAG: class I SAM-dependent methyltransferase, partial [bacterium]|nr:class I SAM-dependent methyltransferase [bacterium]